jgi:hypothetical protein
MSGEAAICQGVREFFTAFSALFWDSSISGAVKQ